MDSWTISMLLTHIALYLTLNIEQHHEGKCSNAKLFTLTAAYISGPGVGKTNLLYGFDTTPHLATHRDLTKLLKGKFCQLNEDLRPGHSWFGVYLRTSADKVTFSCVKFAFCVPTLSSMTNIFLCTLNLICQAGV